MASIIAQFDNDIRRHARALTGCAIDWQGCPLADRLSIEVLHITSETLRLNLDAADDPKAGQYVGAYPSEVDKLTRDTMAAAAEVHSLTDGLGSCGTSTACAGRALVADSAARSLVRQLDGWRPYL